MHYTIFYDAFFWFAVFHNWHWSIALAVAEVCVAKALIFQECSFLTIRIDFVLLYLVDPFC
jgi:hypothetical protein